MIVNRNKLKILNKEEQAGMRKVCRLAREVLDIAARELRPGVTTDHIDKVVHEACLERNVSLMLVLTDNSKFGPRGMFLVGTLAAAETLLI
jgi:methionine aminopeptidase